MENIREVVANWLEDNYGNWDTNGEYTHLYYQRCAKDILSLQGTNSAGEPVRLAVVKVEGKLPTYYAARESNSISPESERLIKQSQQDMLEAHYVQEERLP